MNFQISKNNIHQLANSVCNIQIIKFQQFSEKEADLSIFSSQDKVPFSIKRVFTVQAREACSRGFHAHRECIQLLVVVHGSGRVICDDGAERKAFTLNNASEGLLIPAGIWVEQEYGKDTVFMVLTDQFYDADDYIRDYQEFLQFRNGI